MKWRWFVQRNMKRFRNGTESKQPFALRNEMQTKKMKETLDMILNWSGRRKECRAPNESYVHTNYLTYSMSHSSIDLKCSRRTTLEASWRKTMVQSSVFPEREKKVTQKLCLSQDKTWTSQSNEMNYSALETWQTWWDFGSNREKNGWANFRPFVGAALHSWTSVLLKRTVVQAKENLMGNGMIKDISDIHTLIFDKQSIIESSNNKQPILPRVFVDEIIKIANESLSLEYEYKPYVRFWFKFYLYFPAYEWFCSQGSVSLQRKGTK